MTALASRLLAEVIRIANEYRDGILDSSEMEREAAAALSVPDGREAVAWRVKNLDGNWMYFDFKPDYLENAQPLYTTPQPGDGVVVPDARIARDDADRPHAKALRFISSNGAAGATRAAVFLTAWNKKRGRMRHNV